MKEDIGKIQKLLIEHDDRISKLEEKFREPSKLVKKKLSIKEFLKEKKPKGFTQIALAIGFYYEIYEGLTSFNTKDLEEGFGSSKEPPPKNLNDTANLNVKSGYMMECKERKDNKKAWVLTQSGEDYVASGFIKKN